MSLHPTHTFTRLYVKFVATEAYKVVDTEAGWYEVVSTEQL